MIQLDITNIYRTISHEQINALEAEACKSNNMLHDGTGAGNNFLGWLNLPSSLSPGQLKDIEDTAEKLRSQCEMVVIIGIGGSYLGTKAAVEALSNSFDLLQNERKHPIILYAGHHIGEDYLFELSNLLKGRKFGIINISKSGTTTEPALAFRLLKNQLEEEVGKEIARQRIVAITDKARGALRKLADNEGYKTYIIPDNVGGRFSIFTPVGLLPIAVAGIDIQELVKGASAMEKASAQNIPFAENIAAQYAATRNALYANGKKIEILANFNHKLHFVGEWWKQLYGESEGKENKGIFPASVDLTTDLHSMGQWIQEGERTIFETVVSIDEPDHIIYIPFEDADLDGLNYLAGKRVDEVNKMAELGTQMAHVDGGVPNIKIRLPKLDAYYIGQLFYFFEKACGISGYMLGVNPFNQPGVEAYKKEMFKLLKKPGY
ncbi:MAG: glucose-6-phosphate isomerase [Tannerella sp.]|jgi:glucose-6-phosphate isomerase|nr:glucose-6-phosphate isomerase [Tannerella sp.]